MKIIKVCVYCGNECGEIEGYANDLSHMVNGSDVTLDGKTRLIHNDICPDCYSRIFKPESPAISMPTPDIS